MWKCFASRRSKRISCLLGAGATIPVGGPTTAVITRAARAKLQRAVVDKTANTWGDIPFIEDIAKELDDFLSPDACHFEDIFDVLESLDSYRTGWDPSTTSKFKPRLGAFVASKDPKWFDSFSLICAKRDLLQTIAENIEASITAFSPNGSHKWFRDFWINAFSKAMWDVGTLNYDSLLQTIHPDLEDGYPPSSDFARFSPSQLRRLGRSRILHLHGSVFYGHIPHGKTTDVFVDGWDDLCKFNEISEARATWFGRSNATSQSHEETVIGPLITGLRKTDKLTAHPYDDYQAVFRESLYHSPRLLIAGYSFGDLYLNSIVNRMYSLHGKNRRIVIVSFVPGGQSSWHSDPHLCEWMNDEMFNAFAFATGSRAPLGKSLRYTSYLSSDDGCCKTYFGGTAEAFTKHGDEIIQFLKS